MSDRKTCTAQAPMPNGDTGMWCHPDAKSGYSEFDSGAHGGNYTRYKCPNCNLEFTVEDDDY